MDNVQTAAEAGWNVVIKGETFFADAFTLTAVIFYSIRSYFFVCVLFGVELGYMFGTEFLLGMQGKHICIT